MATDKRPARGQSERTAIQPAPGDADAGRKASAERDEFVSGGRGITGQGRSDTGQAESSYPTIEGQDDRSMEYQGGATGTTGPSGTSDAGGGSDTVGGLTVGVGGTALDNDEQIDKEINRERRETTGGKVSQRDNNIKVD